MKHFGLFAGLLMATALVIAGCSSIDPTGVIMGEQTGSEQSGTPVQAPSQTITPGSSGTSAAGGNWILWRETPLETGKGGALFQRPNLDQRYFKDLKVEVATDNPIDVRFVTLKQNEEYEKALDAYRKRTTTSFDRDAAGSVALHSGISTGSVEEHNDMEMVLIFEPHNDQPAKGTVKIYYQL